jgi:hypothetical protein
MPIIGTKDSSCQFAFSINCYFYLILFTFRPPSRISMRPNRVINEEFVEVQRSSSADGLLRTSSSRNKKLPHYMLPRDVGTYPFDSSATRLSLSDLNIKQQRSRAPSPLRLSAPAAQENINQQPNAVKAPWRPSSAHAESHRANRKKMPTAGSIQFENNRASSRERNSGQSNQIRYTSSDDLHFRPDSGRRGETLMKKRRKKSPHPRARGAGGVKYDDISSSVLKATKNLEQISKHLKTVAESLSESALLNLTNDHIQQQHTTQQISRIENVKVMDDSGEYQPFEESKKSSQLANGRSPGHSKYAPLTASEQENLESFAEELDLENLVRERMHSKLKDILHAQLSM